MSNSRHEAAGLLDAAGIAALQARRSHEFVASIADVANVIEAAERRGVLAGVDCTRYPELPDDC